MVATHTHNVHTNLGICNRHGPDLGLELAQRSQKTRCTGRCLETGRPTSTQPLVPKQNISGATPPCPSSFEGPNRCKLHPDEQILPGWRRRDELRTASLVTSLPRQMPPYQICSQPEKTKEKARVDSRSRCRTGERTRRHRMSCSCHPHNHSPPQKNSNPDTELSLRQGLPTGGNQSSCRITPTATRQTSSTTRKNRIQCGAVA